MSSFEVVRLLKETRDFAASHNWCQRFVARTSEGHPCAANHPHAREFCLIGYMQAVKYYRRHVEETYWSAVEIVSSLIPDTFEHIGLFNDDPSTTKRTIQKLLERAVMHAESNNP